MDFAVKGSHAIRKVRQGTDLQFQRPLKQRLRKLCLANAGRPKNDQKGAAQGIGCKAPEPIPCRWHLRERLEQVWPSPQPGDCGLNLCRLLLLCLLAPDLVQIALLGDGVSYKYSSYFSWESLRCFHSVSGHFESTWYV